MIKKHVTPKGTVNFLNRLLKVDRCAVENLFNIRVYCNNKLAKHPTVQVGRVSKGVYAVGMIGILNGLFGVDKDVWGCICMDLRGGRLKGFRLVTDKDKHPR